MYSLIRWCRNLYIHGPEHVRCGLFRSNVELESYILGAFPWLVSELWHVDKMHGGHFAAQTLSGFDCDGRDEPELRAAIEGLAGTSTSPDATPISANSAESGPDLDPDIGWPELFGSQSDDSSTARAAATAPKSANATATIHRLAGKLPRRLRRSSLDRIDAALVDAVLDSTVATPSAHFPPRAVATGLTSQTRNRKHAGYPGPAYILGDFNAASPVSATLATPVLLGSSVRRSSGLSRT
jgi:hypothetical protein